jgi:hypothetical protein
MRVFSLPNCGNSCQSGGNPLNGALQPYAFFATEWRMSRIAPEGQVQKFRKPFSSLVLFLLCWEFIALLHRRPQTGTGTKTPHNYEYHFAMRKTDFAQPKPTLACAKSVFMMLAFLCRFCSS